MDELPGALKPVCVSFTPRLGTNKQLDPKLLLSDAGAL
jgi:hypothetical protein